MSWEEFLSWCAYRDKYGSLHEGMRLDRAVGRAAAFFGNMMAGKKQLVPEDFSPFDRRIRDNMTIDEQIDEALSNFPRLD